MTNELPGPCIILELVTVPLYHAIHQNGTAKNLKSLWWPNIFIQISVEGRKLEETRQKVDTMLNAFRATPISNLAGDTITSECTRSQQGKRHRYVQEESGYDYTLDMWTAVTCTMNIHGTPPFILANLYIPNKAVPEPNLQTFYLPLYEHLTASFTCVPRTLIPTFFVTAGLTGCDVFVAATGGSADIGCPIVVIHSNFCQDLTFDKSHQVAIAVLATDPLRETRYQIRYRLASENQRRVIEPQHYHYDIDYYNPERPAHIFYGYTHGGPSISQREPWVFCRKEGFTTTTQCHISPDF